MNKGKVENEGEEECEGTNKVGRVDRVNHKKSKHAKLIFSKEFLDKRQSKSYARVWNWCHQSPACFQEKKTMGNGRY